MVEYGYMEDGYLRSKILEPLKQLYKEGDEIKEIVITIEQQISDLDPTIWKPVDLIDDSQMNNPDGYYIIIPIPYDAGNRISYRYEQVSDHQRVHKDIQLLTDELSSSDYKITKCYEATLLGDSLPYNVKELHSERQILRDKINQLEEYLKNENLSNK